MKLATELLLCCACAAHAWQQDFQIGVLPPRAVAKRGYEASHGADRNVSAIAQF